MAGAVDTLFIPHASGVLPALDAAWLFLNAAVPRGGFPANMASHLNCEQAWRDEYLALHAVGIDVAPSVTTDATYQGALVLLTKHKRENLSMIVRANQAVQPGGSIVVAGDKNLGIASIKKWISKSAQIDGSIAKNHATVIWFAASPQNEFSSPAQQGGIAEFKTQPGMFSPDKVDVGSALLSQFIDDGVKGDVADFGAGWGYLSKSIIERAKPRSLTLLDAHWPSLKAAKENVDASKLEVRFDWIDIANEEIKARYDWIVMNPPFHSGRKAEPKLGERFIEVAARSLKKDGKLLMVANTNLPYEATLKDNFRTHECVKIESGFKVLKAVR